MSRVMPTRAKEFFSPEEYAWIENLSKYWESDLEEGTYKPFTTDRGLAFSCACLAERILEDDPQDVEWWLETNEKSVNRYRGDETFGRLMVMGLEFGVACGDGACANYLGAMYYAGSVVEQDYARAKGLYEIAEQEGVPQASINLGYVYEYGRAGKPDFGRAFAQYAKMAALGYAEALYKLGDMYARGRFVTRDDKTALALYECSFQQATGDVAKAQSAFRIAEYISTNGHEEQGISCNPMRALELYQLAERGLRIDIAHGQDCYERRLEEALEGQQRIRDAIASGEVKL